MLPVEYSQLLPTLLQPLPNPEDHPPSLLPTPLNIQSQIFSQRLYDLPQLFLSCHCLPTMRLTGRSSIPSPHYPGNLQEMFELGMSPMRICHSSPPSLSMPTDGSIGLDLPRRWMNSDLQVWRQSAQFLQVNIDPR